MESELQQIANGTCGCMCALRTYLKITASLSSHTVGSDDFPLLDS